jgi:NifU-like protein
VIDKADAVGEVGSIVCGDALTLYLKIEDNVIRTPKFQTFGCGSAIRHPPRRHRDDQGKTVQEAEKITNRDIVEYLGAAGAEDALLGTGREALDNGLANWRGIELKDAEEHEGEIVCQCFGVTDALIRR